MNEKLQQLWEALDFKLFEIAGTPITLATLVTVLLVVVSTFVVSRLIRTAASAAFQRRGITGSGTVAAVNRLIHYVVMFVGLGIALQTAGIDLGTLFAAGAVFAVGLGFAMQNIAQNFVAGVILLVERAIKPGDVLRVDGTVVRVQEMGIRATIVRSRDGEDLIVPNASLVQSTVVNYTLRDSQFRVRHGVGVTYGSDMTRVRSELEAVAQQISKRWGVEDKEPQVLLLEFGDNAVIWEVGVWMKDPWSERPAKSELSSAVWEAFHAAEIVIAFPQVDVHFDPPVANGLARLAAASG
jgi:small-conductance mechanosensitive channel